MAIHVVNGVWKVKVIMAGEASVGKTTLVNRYIAGTFSSEYKATIGVNIFSRDITIKKDNMSLRVKLTVWDVAGQTLFRDFSKKFFVNSRCGVLVFDLTMPSSLTNLHSWIHDIHEATGNSIPLILIGNKMDLNDLIAVTPEEVATFLEQHPSIVANFNTSAKTGQNVKTTFLNLISRLI